MFFFMTTNKKQQCYPLWFFSWRPIKNNSVTPYVFFMTTNKKQRCYPLCFFSWRPIKNNVTPYVFFHDDQRKTTVLPLMLFSWRPIKNLSVTPQVSFDKNDSVTLYVLINKYRQCYPWCFFSWQPIKNNSVNPDGFFHDDQRKTTVSPLMFHLIRTTVLPPML